MQSLGNKRILITGAGRGIGRALALRFAAEGAAVVLTDLDDQALADAAGAAGEAGAPSVHARADDVRDPASAARLRAWMLDECGPPDVLVNNAGVVHGGAFLDVPLERHLDTFRVNTLGLVALTHAFLPDLIARPEAALVNMASASGLLGLPFASTYAASKWSVIGFSDSVRLELKLLGHRHVRVTTVCPSYVSTGLFAGARPPRATPELSPERLAARVVDAVRRGRPYVLVPWLVRLTPVLKGLLPRAVFEQVTELFGATTSMRRWRGRTGRGTRNP